MAVGICHGVRYNGASRPAEPEAAGTHTSHHTDVGPVHCFPAGTAPVEIPNRAKKIWPTSLSVSHVSQPHFLVRFHGRMGPPN